MLDDEALVAKLEEISCTLNEIKDKQINIEKAIQKNNKILMQRINKLEEYNEIGDTRIKYFNSQLEKIKQIINKLYY